jgi:hypothetical protein
MGRWEDEKMRRRESVKVGRWEAEMTFKPD